jgi:glycosyltransferase involved in cell wall biosynthesis
MELRPEINYESRENSFEKCAHVKSRFVYGELSCIPNPWLSVVIPTYCRVDLLKQALDSVLAQWHVDFFWDIVVVDNEPDDGQENETERLIRSYENKRILYYRNSENIRPGDNFNRCFLLARGEWVMMLHDDDLLVENTLQVMGRLINAYSGEQKPLGAIMATYIQVEYDAARNTINADISGMNQYLRSQPMDYHLYQLTHNNVKVLAHIGGSAPSNGSTFSRKAVIEAGGFNEDFGISGDLILLYNMENQYNVYQTTYPIGFYRWGVNSMMKKESLFRVIRDNFHFREYVYQKNWFNRLIGKLFRSCHYKTFTSFAIRERCNVSAEYYSLSDFDQIYSQRPNPVWYLFYQCVICQIYNRHKKRQGNAHAKKAVRALGTG